VIFDQFRESDAVQSSAAEYPRRISDFTVRFCSIGALRSAADVPLMKHANANSAAKAATRTRRFTVRSRAKHKTRRALSGTHRPVASDDAPVSRGGSAVIADLAWFKFWRTLDPLSIYVGSS
jgi:hypothetical protein